MKIFDLKSIPLEGIHLVESSAGTGKTYNITGIYLKAIVQKKLSVNQLLVVTFTKAATSELRERIGSALIQASKYFADNTAVDPEEFIINLYEEFGQNKSAQKALQIAALEYDQMAISTIHGFCQQMLQEYVFESNSHFDIVYTGNETEILTEAADSLWRELLNEIKDIAYDDVNYPYKKFLLKNVCNPEAIITKCKPFLSKKNVVTAKKVNAVGLQITFNRLVNELNKAFDANDIYKLLTSESINKNKYREPSVRGIIDFTQSYLKKGHFDFSILEQKDFKLLTFSNLLVKKTHQIPEHPVFEIADNLYKIDIANCIETWWITIAEKFQKRVKEIKQNRRIRSFDDILSSMDNALDNQKMKMLVRERYPIAMVDEFQDTDPVQASIFQKIYDESAQTGLFLIGDPKQSIYRFRSADIKTYLTIRNRKDVQLYNLDKNYRSSSNIVESVNKLFKVKDGEKWPGDIAFFESKAAHHNLKITTESKEQPTGISFLLEQDSSDTVSSLMGQRASINMTCSEISALLHEPHYLYNSNEKSKLKASDIAILIDSHAQAAAYKKALSKQNIKAVISSKSSIFESDESDFIIQLLQITENPTLLSTVRFVLNSTYVGIRSNKLVDHNPLNDLSSYINSLRELNITFKENGFMAFMQKFLGLRISEWENHLIPIREFIALRSDAERVFTNFNHLAELINEDQTTSDLSPAELASWIHHKKNESNTENVEIRLESDENAVKIITIHSSKGLEFPIVFCPLLWKKSPQNNKGNEPLVFYDDSGLQRICFSNVSGTEKARARREEWEEIIRLMYVALTRAKYKTYVCVANYDYKSVLDWLLDDAAVKSLDGLGSKRNNESLLDKVEILCSDYPQLFTVISNFEKFIIEDPDEEKLEKFEILNFNRKDVSKPGWISTSYSGLKKGLQTEVDQIDSKYEDASHPVPVSSNDIYGFQKGANAGVFMHQLFEDLDFENFNENSINYINDLLIEYGFDTKWSNVIHKMVANTLGVELPQISSSLGTIPSNKCLKEMEFYFSFYQADAQSILDIIKDKSSHQSSKLYGFINGFIDLVFEYDGKYYILDYKSDYLGNSIDFYSSEAIEASIAERGYNIQYHIYSLALFRYLKQFIPNFNYDSHFGGCYYLYLRGIGIGANTGIYFQKPSRKIVEKLDQYFSMEVDV